MEEGQMRCDINISVNTEQKEGNRVEIKNVLGIKFVEKAIEYEIQRHVDLLRQGKDIVKETRRYDTLKDTTFSMRSKEQDPDYRFFQEPDLPTFKVSEERIQRVREKLEKTPFDKKKEFASKYQLSIADVQTAFNYPWSIAIFEELAHSRDPKVVFNW